jgi:hypothetical protein
MAAKEEDFRSLDQQTYGEWSGRKEMQTGDLAFMYRMSPRKAITGIYRVEGEPRFDPWGAWDGFWADPILLCAIPDIAFAEMRHDPVLSEWFVVRKQFQGTVTDPMPHSVYNQLLTKIPLETRNAHGLQPEPVATVGRSGQFASEAKFEEKVVEPLLKRWGFRYKAQASCRFPMGSGNYRGRVDFLVSDEQGPLTLFEDKLRVVNDSEQDAAAGQARSYALILGLPSFVVAAPEGLWAYSLDQNRETLELHLSAGELEQGDERMRALLLRLRR